MLSCPRRADVVVANVERGVAVTVTGKDEATTREIRERAKRMSDMDTVDAGTGRHDHSGAGGGATGRCTVIMRDTKLVTAEIPNGAKITVTPKDPSELD